MRVRSANGIAGSSILLVDRASGCFPLLSLKKMSAIHAYHTYAMNVLRAHALNAFAQRDDSKVAIQGIRTLKDEEGQ